MKRENKMLSVCLAVVFIMAFAFRVAPFTYAVSAGGMLEIKIVHTNDIHARVQENTKSGIIGMAKLKTIIDDYTDSADASLVLDSGDLFHGLPIATLSNGGSVAQLVSECGFDAITPGNHDWSYGKDRLKELGSIAGTDILCGNVVKDDGTGFFDKSYLIKKTEKNGKTYKIGVFGVIDPAIYKSTSAYNVAGLTFTDPVIYAKKAVDDLKKSGCDIIIALSHTYNPADIAKQVDGVNVWLAGHEHIDIDTSVSTPDGGIAYVIENEFYLQSIGLIQLDCEIDEDGKIGSVSCKNSALNYEAASKYESNPATVNLLKKINEEQAGVLSKPAGRSPAELDGAWENLRIGQTNLGKAVSAAYLLETGADVAFENAGGIRASVAAGTVTYGNIISVSPYGNYVITKQITGKQLTDVMETAIDIQLRAKAAFDSGINDAWPKNSGSYLQFSGMTVTYNPSLDMGKRVISIDVGGKQLEESKLYIVAMNNYTSTDSNYSAFCNAQEIGEYCACDQILAKYFAQNENLILADISKQNMIETDKTVQDSVPEKIIKTTDTDDISVERSIKSDDAIPKTGDVYELDGAAFICIAAVIIIISLKKKLNIFSNLSFNR